MRTNDRLEYNNSILKRMSDEEWAMLDSRYKDLPGLIDFVLDSIPLGREIAYPFKYIMKAGENNHWPIK